MTRVLDLGEGLALPIDACTETFLVVEAYPRGVTGDALTEATDYKRSTRDAYVQRLASRKLVERTRGEVRASETLFEGGA